MIDRRAASVLLARESHRAARRSSLWRFRVAVLGTGLCFLAWTVDSLLGRIYDPAYMSEAGRQLFNIGKGTLFALATFVTPLLTARSVQDERDGKTLPLLALTGMRPESILFGNALARLLQAEVLMIGTLPLFALCLSMGGAGPRDALAAFAAVQAQVLLTGSLGALFGIVLRAPLAAVVMTWAWTFLLTLPGALPAAWGTDIRYDEEWGIALMSPAGALVTDAPLPFRLGAHLVQAIAAALLLPLGGRLLAEVAGEEPQDSAMSPFAEARRRLTGRLVVGAIGLAVLAAPVIVAVEGYGLHGFDGVMVVAGPMWNLAAVFVATPLVLLAMRRVAAGATTSLARPRRWEEVARADEDLVLRANGLRRPRSLSLVEPSGTKVRAARLPGMQQIWANPVAWREIVTRAHGPLTAWIGRLEILALAGLVVTTLNEPLFETSGRDSQQLGVALMMLAVAIGVTIATSAGLAERRSGTLDLLSITPLGGVRVVTGKVLGVAAYVLAPIGMSGFLLLASQSAMANAWGIDPPEYLADPALAAFRWFGMMSVGVGAVAFLSAGSLAWALRAKSAATAYGGAFGGVAALAILPAVLVVTSRGQGRLTAVAEALNPALNEEFWSGPFPLSAVLSAVVWLGLSFAVLMRAAQRLDRIAA